MVKSEELNRLGKRIKEIRLAKNLSQSQLAHRIDRERPSISRLETGKINPTYFFLKELCEGLDVHISELLEFE